MIVWIYCVLSPCQFSFTLSVSICSGWHLPVVSVSLLSGWQRAGLTLRHLWVFWTNILDWRNVSRTLWTHSKLMTDQDKELSHRPSYDMSLHSSVIKWPALKVFIFSSIIITSIHFPVAGPKTWNALPEDVTSSQSQYTFRRQLKTWLFKKSFPDIIIWYWLHLDFLA